MTHHSSVRHKSWGKKSIKIFLFILWYAQDSTQRKQTFEIEKCDVVLKELMIKSC